MSITVNKRRYYRYDASRKKNTAKKTAKRLRKLGWLVRVKKQDGFYHIYRRGR